MDFQTFKYNSSILWSISESLFKEIWDQVSKLCQCKKKWAVFSISSRQLMNGSRVSLKLCLNVSCLSWPKVTLSLVKNFNSSELWMPNNELEGDLVSLRTVFLKPKNEMMRWGRAADVDFKSNLRILISSGCGFESRCSHLNFRYRACFEQGVTWHSGKYRVWIYSEKRTWYDKSIQSNALYR